MRGRDLNPRPPGYEPDELPNCSTPRYRLKLDYYTTAPYPCQARNSDFTEKRFRISHSFGFHGKTRGFCGESVSGSASEANCIPRERRSKAAKQSTSVSASFLQIRRRSCGKTAQQNRTKEPRSHSQETRDKGIVFSTRRGYNIPIKQPNNRVNREGYDQWNPKS